MAKLSNIYQRRLDGFSGVQGLVPCLGTFVVFFTFMIPVVSSQGLHCVHSLSSDETQGNWFMLNKLIGNGPIKRKVNCFIYKKKCNYQADGISYVTWSIPPCFHWRSRLETPAWQYSSLEDSKNKWWCKAPLALPFCTVGSHGQCEWNTPLDLTHGKPSVNIIKYDDGAVHILPMVTVIYQRWVLNYLQP